MVMANTPEFGKWQAILWPIHRHELKKILPMVLMFYLVIFNHTILRDTKDAIVITCQGSGAEVIPFIKLWVHIPLAIVFTIFYSKLCNLLRQETLFYLIISGFLFFFIFFSLVMYPAQHLLHPHAFADQLEHLLPVGLKGMIALIRNWSFSLFYVMAELWGTVCLSLLFWGFANHITNLSESKRFYALFGVLGNLAQPSAGLFVYYASRTTAHLPEGVDSWGDTIKVLTSAVTLGGIIIMGTYWWINRYVLTDPRLFTSNTKGGSTSQKLSMSLSDSFLQIIRNRSLLCISILVISYGVCINMIELTWKNQLHMQFPTPNEFNQFMGLFSTITGFATVLIMIFLTNNLIRHFGWTKTALCTPVTLLITGSLFFCFVLFRDILPEGLFIMMGITPLMCTVLIGAAQNIVSKATKYGLFDPTKEMSYIPLDPEVKTKGKAAVDVIGTPLGKSAGSVIQQILMIFFGSLSMIAPYIAMVMVAFLFIWIIAVKSLGRQFQEPSDESMHFTHQQSNQ